MKNIITVFLLLFFFSTRAQIIVSWVNYPGGVAVASDATDNVYTANWDYNPGGDITLTKRDVQGTILWEESFDNTDNSRHETATWVETDSSGNIIVSGTIRSGFSNPVNAASVLMKYDPSGNLMWRVVYESDFDGSSAVKCLVDPSGNIYVLGFGTNGTGMVAKVRKFTPEGVPLWTYFDNDGIGRPVNFKFTPDGGMVIIARAIYGSINGYAKIDLEGNHLWSYAGINSLTVGDAAGDAYGNSYLINGEYVPVNAGSVIKKLSPTGSVIWEQTNTMAGLRVEVGTDDHPVISGYPNAGSFGAAFMKYDDNGAVLWENLDADGPGLMLLAHSQMRLDGTNAAYLAAGTMFAMAVCKVNSDGTSAWTATPSGSYANAIDFGNGDSSILVTGSTTARLVQAGTVTAVDKMDDPGFKIYPNPVKEGKFTLEMNQNLSKGAELHIYSVMGQKVGWTPLQERKNTISTEGLRKGLYLLEILTDNDSPKTAEIVIND